MRSQSNRLFGDFLPVAAEEWERKIRDDLKGADYDETLLWRSADDLRLRPYYRSEDLETLPHIRPDGPTVQLDSRWQIQQNLTATTVTDAANQTRAAVEGGSNRVGLVLHDRDGASDPRQPGSIHTPKPIPMQRLDDWERVLAAVPLEDVGIHIDGGPESLRHFGMYLDLAEQRSVDTGSLQGSVGFDPAAHLAQTGILSREAFDSAAQDLEELDGAAPHFRLIEAGTAGYHNAGASVVQEAALAAAAIAEYLDQFQKRGFDPRDVLSRLFVSAAVSSTFFEEVAKLRALRLLIPQVARAFGAEPKDAEIPIHVQTSLRSMTRYDAHTNLVRATTEAAAAVIGGCDVLIVQPYDAAVGDPVPSSMRLARNIHHLLRCEANFDRTDDPAAGSYYTEVLTDSVARRAWEQFKNIEENGGLLKALESGYVQEQLRASRDRVERDVATRRRVLVGTNRYADPTPSNTDTGRDEPAPVAAPDTTRDADRNDDTAGMGQWTAEPIDGFREADVIERVRSVFERLDGRPTARILPIGPPATRSARAELAAEVLACGGIVSETIEGFNSLSEAVEYATTGEAAASEILIVAAPDDAYIVDVLDDIKRLFRPSAIGIVSEVNVVHEADFVIGRQVHVPELLAQISEILDLS